MDIVDCCWRKAFIIEAAENRGILDKFKITINNFYSNIVEVDRGFFT